MIGRRAIIIKTDIQRKIEGKNIQLKLLEESDLTTLWQHIYGVKNPEWKEWDAPYFHLEHKELDTYKLEMASLISNGLLNRRAIMKDGQIIGTVSYYWEHKPSNWLEVGIVIYDPGYWSGGYGTEAIKLWIDHLFAELPLQRIGYTTWSGNQRMIKVGEKLGMQMEARIRKARFYNGEYYDSIKMGILREEWEKLHCNKQ